MYKVSNGPVAFFDCDDTLIMWRPSQEEIEKFGLKSVKLLCRGLESRYYVHPHNVQFLIDLAKRGHSIIVWSRGGSDWAEAVVTALEIENYVEVVTSKPQYWIDDQKDPARCLGRHQYINLKGTPSDPYPFQKS